MIDGADWSLTNTNISAILQSPFIKLDFFITHKIGRCVDPRDPETTILCWRYNKIFDVSYKSFFNDTSKTRVNILKKLKEIDYMVTVDAELVNASISHFLNFLENKISLNYPGREQIPLIIKIKDISRILLPPDTKLHLDWLAIVNEGFLEHSQAVSDEEEILIEDWSIFAKSLELIESTNLRNIIDVFFIVFLIRYEHTYNPYSSKGELVKQKYDTERFEICLNFLQMNLAPGMLSLLSNEYKVKNKQVESFINEALKEVLSEINEVSNIESVVKDDIKRKFKKIKIIYGINEEIYDSEKMKELYQEIELNGDEGILETTNKLIIFNEKLNNEPRSNWHFLVNQLSHLGSIKYFPEIDVLFIPIEYLMYPYYDVARPRFFNTATLFAETVLNVHEGLKRYMISVNIFIFKNIKLFKIHLSPYNSFLNFCYLKI